MAVAGGSKGLGLEVARAFGHAGAKVVLMARTETDLDEAVRQLAGEQIDVEQQVFDATDWESVEQAFEQIISRFGDLKVLVNAIGKSTRANIEQLDLAEAEHLMDVNYFSALRCTKAAMGSLAKQNGHLVNIGSLSSKTAWPYMTPYTASKFALAGLTHQCRIELGHQFHSMLVCPGPIKREDAGTRYEKHASGLPEEAQQPGGGAKVKGVCPRKLAKRIVRGCEKRKAEIIVPFKAKILFIAASISTRLGDWLLGKSRKS